jgi:hypothetical protein
MCELDELDEIELTDEECTNWGKENFNRAVRTGKYNRTLCRVTEKPTPAAKQDYWKSAMAKAMAEQESKWTA